MGSLILVRRLMKPLLGFSLLLAGVTLLISSYIHTVVEVPDFPGFTTRTDVVYVPLESGGYGERRTYLQHLLGLRSESRSRRLAWTLSALLFVTGIGVLKTYELVWPKRPA
jgi:hypothetical protein